MAAGFVLADEGRHMGSFVRSCGGPPSPKSCARNAMVRVAFSVTLILLFVSYLTAQQPPAASPQRVAPTFHADFCAWLPTDIPHADAVHGVCTYAMTLPTTIPNFICDERTSRYWGDNPVPRDMISAVVRYEDGSESYTDVKVNGNLAPVAISGSPGLWSTGEFGSNLRAIFDVRNLPLFDFVGENTLNGHQVWMFSFRIVKQNDPMWRLHDAKQDLAPPYAGELWVDQTNGTLLRFRQGTTDMPPKFAMRSAELLTDYALTAFADGTNFVLPIEATVATRFGKEPLRRNVVEFSNCHKFGAKFRIVLDEHSPGVSAIPRAADLATAPAKEREESEQIYAVLREQSVREDAAETAAELQRNLNFFTSAALTRVTALEVAQQKSAADRAVVAAAAMTAPPSAPDTVLKVSVKLVPVSVVLRDAKGNAVGNLRKEDFQLFDNNKPQPISSFTVEKSASSSQPSKADMSATDGSTLAFVQSGPSAAALRDVAYVFDDVHTSFEDLASARDAAARHLAALDPDDRAAVFMTSGASAVDFTADREKLLAVLKTLRPHPIRSGANCPPISYYMADLIVNQNDSQTLGLATQDTINCQFGGMKSAMEMERAEQIAKSTAIEVLSASSAENQAALGVLSEVVRRTAALPGSRSIVVVSPGFLTLTPETREAVMGLVDLAVRANIVIHALDVRGLYTVGMQANTSHSADPAVRLGLDKDDALLRSDVMSDLAYGTGGTFFHNNNDLDEGFRRTADAPEYVYVLGFSPEKLDGKFHKLKVKLPGPEKLTVQARQGYYALKPATAQ
jgi:VWFA-related protein